MNLKELPALGQSIWLDYIRRDLLTSGEFARMVRDDGIRGVTTNPSIFEEAIGGSTEYDAAIARYAREADEPAAALYERLSMEDIQEAADVLRSVYDATDHRDGFISMEVSPRLAHDTSGTLGEARRLWKRVARDNLMIKVPATPAGLPAITRLISEGINVNITLLFSRTACRQVARAYMTGLEAVAARKGPLDRIASVASMFVSRIDAKVDPLMEARDPTAHGALRGKVAIANAKLAYHDWKEMCASPRWQVLAAKGARAQRLLWASTSTKDKRLRDTLYVEELIGPETVDTIPLATLNAMRDHGTAESRLEQGIDEARDVLTALARAGISIDDVTQQLLDEGVAAFSKSFDALMASIEQKRATVHGNLRDLAAVV
jgi:transaldolase